MVDSGAEMKDSKVEAVETQMRLRAIAVASGLMTEAQAEQWIVVKGGELGKGHFKDVIPPVCPGCGSDHTSEEWIPLEIAIHRAMPEATRDAFMRLVEQSNGSVN
jgi:hypothetical protein